MMTDREFRAMLDLERDLTPEEFDEFVDEWLRRLPEMQRRTKEAIESMKRSRRVSLFQRL